MSPSEGSAVAHARRVSLALEGKSINPLDSYEEINMAFKKCDTVLERLDIDTSVLAERLITTTAIRNKVFRLLNRFAWIYEKRYGQQYPIARMRASSAVRYSGARKTLLSQGDGCCAHCKGAKDLTVDHIVAVKNGGGNELENLQILCRPCNSKKGSK